MSELRGHYRATLDGETVVETDDGFAFEDGRPVDKAREEDVVFVATEPDSEAAILAELLAVGSAPLEVSATDDIEAGFFHRTLNAWIVGDDDEDLEAPVWDYDCWKAEVVPARPEGERSIFVASLYFGERAPEEYRYWLALEDDGRIKESGWLSAPPDLLNSGERFSIEGEGAAALSREAAALILDEF